jgi:hypothetical protein
MVVWFHAAFRWLLLFLAMEPEILGFAWGLGLGRTRQRAWGIAHLLRSTTSEDALKSQTVRREVEINIESSPIELKRPLTPIAPERDRQFRVVEEGALVHTVGHGQWA